MPKGQEERANRLAELETALATVDSTIEKLKLVEIRAGELQQEIARIRKTRAPQHLATLKDDYQDVGISVADWPSFEMIFRGDVDTILVNANR